MNAAPLVPRPAEVAAALYPEMMSHDTPRHSEAIAAMGPAIKNLVDQVEASRDVKPPASLSP